MDELASQPNSLMPLLPSCFQLTVNAGYFLKNDLGLFLNLNHAFIIETMTTKLPRTSRKNPDHNVSLTITVLNLQPFIYFSFQTKQRVCDCFLVEICMFLCDFIIITIRDIFSDYRDIFCPLPHSLSPPPPPPPLFSLSPLARVSSLPLWTGLDQEDYKGFVFQRGER